MKKEWSPKWVASSQVRKQRKYRHNAPLHIKHGLLSAHLSKELRMQYKRRSFPLRKGDEVEVMRGRASGTRGVVDRVDMKALKVYVDSVKVKKTDGREVTAALEPSNLQIMRFSLDDKKRQKSLLKQKVKAGTGIKMEETKKEGKE